MKYQISLFLLFLSFNAGAVEVLNVDPVCKDLSWYAPTEREDGTPLEPSEIKEYVIYRGVEPGVYINAARTTTTNISCEALKAQPGVNYFAGITIDTNGVTSRLSNEITRTIKAKPKAPELGAQSITTD